MDKNKPRENLVVKSGTKPFLVSRRKQFSQRLYLSPFSSFSYASLIFKRILYPSLLLAHFLASLLALHSSVPLH